ncbi:ricin-type beta-trefoil lectin domain protein [Micromonospora mirobrigensis]|uniref:Ricin-type beta-trefoil lectin domain-containing protein n=1 Tax=Micromonospora mirobrigensis TaxID=262898 RepID=A0A1C5AL15_9ACTN|nr:ricin-type beta-trefoil lectin domain protein [Micromonospora mirobrigensis]SCF45816.1 Ricin-type beta-trefoil lectin domain-containing protein [Micromonospora mirobrigensis]
MFLSTRDRVGPPRRLAFAAIALATLLSALVTMHATKAAAATGDSTFSSGKPDYDAAYVKALADIHADVVNGKFIAGTNWAEIWTRDSAYSADLGAGFVEPTVTVATMRGLTEKDAQLGDVWIQDVCGHFGGWPNLSDAIVGAVGAWAAYLNSGDQDFLRWSYGVTKNSLARAERDEFDAGSGLFRGVASFMESNSAYPSTFANNGAAAGRTKSLATNLLHYRAYVIAARMGQLLGENVSTLEAGAANLKKAINDRLWLAGKGYYAYYEDANGIRSDRMEGLGEALAVLWGVADPARAASVLRNTPTTAQGLPSLSPQYAEWKNYSGIDSSYYHNGMVWPFVQAYWGWAAASQSDVTTFDTEFAKLVALSKRDTSFREFYRPEDGTPDGSPRQLWSAAGYLSMVYHGLFGMNLASDGITFRPTVPASFSNLRLDGFRYRGASFNLTLTGSGTRISSFKLDSTERTDRRIPNNLTGSHTVTIIMGDSAKAQIRSGISGKCLAVAGGLTSDGTAVQSTTCSTTGDAAQQWIVGTEGSLRALGKCLDADHSGVVDGTRVQLWTCNGSAAQRWIAGASGSLRNVHAGRCLDVPGSSTTNGLQVQLYTCNGGPGQQWTLPS